MPRMGIIISMGLTIIVALLLGVDPFYLGCAVVIGISLSYMFSPKKPR